MSGTTNKTEIKSFDDFIESDVDVGEPTKPKAKPKPKATTNKTDEAKPKEPDNKVLKAQMESIIHAMNEMDEAKEAIKEICADIKDKWDIKPSVTKGAAKIMRDPEILKRMEDHAFAVDQLYNKVKK